MGATKSYEFSDKKDKLAKALGRPARIAILNLLPKRQTCVYGDIVDELLLFQSSFIASKRIERYRINNLRN